MIIIVYDKVFKEARMIVKQPSNPEDPAWCPEGMGNLRVPDNFFDDIGDISYESFLKPYIESHIDAQEE